MIDFDGYRPNVGIVICNHLGQVLWAKRYGQNSWQFPQGGIKENETPEQAMYRELYEEVGLSKKDVRIVYASRNWLRYKLPKRLLRHDSKPMCIGQKQRWFLLQLTAEDKAVNLACSKTPEFDGWRWVSFWYPVRQVVSFKRDVYRRAMKEFALALFDSNKESVMLEPKPQTEKTPHKKNAYYHKSQYKTKKNRRF
ncbi:RNA pyrophosphohydrolase [Pasteurellaceae bacterium Pebbles2]|nr:RNA pyrophosphohydrolase [Pasteurellaceae bacterium Pebbles2]